MYGFNRCEEDGALLPDRIPAGLVGYNETMRELGDFHVHSDISPDSTESMENAARTALARGLTEIAFTDHYDEDYPYEGFDRPDFQRYFENLSWVRAAFPELVIRSGTELGMMREANDAIRDWMAPWDFDFVLFSKHVVRRKDPWYEDYYAGRTLREGEQDYLEEMIADIRAYDDFDVVGHIGYVDKYLDRYTNPPEGSVRFEYQDFPDQIDTLLKELIGRGKGIEVNTSSYADQGEFMPRRSVLKRYRELGGEIITLGSDAHEAARVGSHFPEALGLLAELGFRWVCTFAGRTPHFEPITTGGHE